MPQIALPHSSLPAWLVLAVHLGDRLLSLYPASAAGGNQCPPLADVYEALQLKTVTATRLEVGGE